MMRLSVLTTEIGRRLAGVYALPSRSEMLDGFLGRRCRIAWLKSDGGVCGESDSMSLTMREKIGCAMDRSIL